MRLKVELTSNSTIVLPLGYNQYIQALIYNHISEKEAKWLYDHGLASGKDSFKLFTFSDICEKGSFNKTTKTLNYNKKISFFIASPVKWILKQLAQNILASERVEIGNNDLKVFAVNVLDTSHISNKQVKIRTLSPIEVHSTLFKNSGKEKTRYYSPFEDDFNELINKNLKKKWMSFHYDECEYDISITPLFERSKNKKIRHFGTGEDSAEIKGWHGYFLVEGDPEVIGFALETGLGSRNSQGFGMVEIVE